MIKIIYYLIFISFFSNVYATEVTIIELDNNKIDQSLLDNLEISNQDEENVVLDINESILDENSNEDIVDYETNIIEESNEIETQENIDINNISFSDEFWTRIEKEEFDFLLSKILDINSFTLRDELISKLAVDFSPPSGLNQIDFENIIIKNLINFGERDKAFNIIRNLQDLDNKGYKNFYNFFQINYLLSSYKLSEACDFRDRLTDEQVGIKKNFYLKIDIFCLFLNEKFDEADLLNSLLDESAINKDQYFQYIYNKLKNPDEEIKNIITFDIDEDSLFIYSAMHRVGNVPLNEKFLEIDSLNLSMPIILSSSTDISLRLKAAHLAYQKGLIGIDSLSALYLAADFSYEELNESTSENKLFSNSEMGMAYHYQLINVQIMPNDRLKTIINFWQYAEKNNLQIISYQLSKKFLDTITPVNELASFGAEIAKAYIYNENLVLAEKWLLFAKNTSDLKINEIQSVELLLRLTKANQSEEFIKILTDSLKDINTDFINTDIKNVNNQEILYIIYSVLDLNNKNPFEIIKKIEDSRKISSTYIFNNIREGIKHKNDSRLLLNIILSFNDNNWDELHPEMLRLILMGIKDYNNGELLKKIIFEILQQSKII